MERLYRFSLIFLILILFSFSSKNSIASIIIGPDVFLLNEPNLLENGDLDENDFGLISNWASSGIELSRWYLVQDVQPTAENRETRWIERVHLDEEERMYGLKSMDYQTCSFFCSVSAVQIIPAQENKVYNLSAEARVEDGGSGSLYLDFLNVHRGRIKPFTVGGYNEQWSRQTVTASSPTGTKYIRVILYSANNPQGIVYWDDVRLIEDEDPIPTAITEIDDTEPSTQIVTYTIPISNSLIFLPLVQQ